MKKAILLLTASLLFIMMSCSSDEGGSRSETASNSGIGLFDSTGGGFGGSSGGVSGSDPTGGSGDPDGGTGGEPGESPGLITAGEWNDLDTWDFWKTLNEKEEFSGKASYWDFYTSNRISVELRNNDNPVIDADLVLSKDGESVWEARTDNFGKAELWIRLFEEGSSPDMSAYDLTVNGITTNTSLNLYDQGVNVINVSAIGSRTNHIDLAFIVDATGSMGDELEFLKSDLNDVIQKVESNNTNLEISTGSVFYRDEGDDYVVRTSGFSSNLNNTVGFISIQRAEGGGDYPEAVHSGLDEAVNNLQWSEEAKARIAFLILDAPPHHTADVIANMQNSIKTAAAKGIKVIPVTASGIDKDTEFLMRFFSISTNGTYVFITDDSGIGGEHLEPSIGEFEVEFLNDLMVRLINKYTE